MYLSFIFTLLENFGYPYFMCKSFKLQVDYLNETLKKDPQYKDPSLVIIQSYFVRSFASLIEAEGS